MGSAKIQAKANESRTLDTVGPSGTGFSINSNESSEKANQKQIWTSDEGRWDIIVSRAFNAVISFLPSPDSADPQSYDLLPHHSIRSLIILSYLPELISDLLINDSVTDWTIRSEVYNSMLSLLRCMANSELTVNALVEEKWEKKKSQGLEAWMWREGAVEWEKTRDNLSILRAPPIYDRFKKLTKQCETFLAGVAHLLENDGDDETVEMTIKTTSLCGDMISAQQDMQRIISVLTRGKAPKTSTSQSTTPDAKGKGKDPNFELEKRYAVECEKLAFKYVPLHTEADNSGGGLDFQGFHYKKEVTATEKSTRLPKDRLHLIKEISALSTSLPPGVWVRVDDVRTDVIKFMIAGPEGTPYANGLYEFHCFMPINYPNSPPLINFQTTGGGKVRFNPNLYNNGKVCLSLLGSNENEQWSPSQSTLLQVIVSIQSMILVEAPYFNE
ncbi:hypothetical protein M422DRAFT_58490 [Sphaerobolus stellatus SS14]|nr:hypothetical protein M422DRAFT_58490 [Sphaerobolus stellatus SS14]